MANTGRYTYVMFASEVQELATVALTNKLIDAAAFERITGKANALAGTQEKKAAYNAANPKKTTPKGMGEATRAILEAILPAIGSEAVTGGDINALLGTNYQPLQIANAIKYAENVEKVKVIREIVNEKGLTSQREYTAYRLK